MPLSRSNFFATRTSLALCASALLSATVVGCKKDDQAGMQGGYQPYQPMAGTGGMPGAQAGAAATQAGGAAGAGGIGAPPTGPIAQKLDVSAAIGVRPFLDQAAKDNTQPGAKPIGETLVGNFGTGQTLDTQILLQPNKCYTVVATSLPPVTEVNVQLVLLTPLAGMAPVLAVDQDAGPTAVLGKKATCYKWMFGTIPASAKFVVQVTGGSGLVVAQAYEK